MPSQVDQATPLAVDPSDRKFYLASPEPGAIQRFDAALASQSRSHGQTLDESRWKSSHNSYQREETIFEQWRDWGVHSFELDIHAGDPDRQIFTADNRPNNDWYVYHDGTRLDFLPGPLGRNSHYTYLSDGIQDIIDIQQVKPDHEPITLFIDLKGDDVLTHDGQLPDDLDQLLRTAFGATLFTPQDLVDSADDAITLHQALRQSGWPAVNVLQGKVIVVLTGGDTDGKLGDYAAEPSAAVKRAAFIAPDVEITNAESGVPTFASSPNAVFYNMKGSRMADAHLVTDQGYLLRLWDLNNEDAFTRAQSSGAHYLGTDKVNTDRDSWASLQP